jgi:spoIIIJ-associated protein
MENFKEFQGRDLEDALNRASHELDRPEDELDYEVVSEGRKGWFLGMGGREFRIRVRMAKPAAYETPPDDGQFEIIESMLADMLRGMHLDVKYRVWQAEDSLQVNLTGPDRDYLLDDKAETLNALQFLLTRMSRGSFPDGVRIVVDSDGFRKEREDDIVRMARDAAGRVRRDGEPQRLPPLNPYERRLVHTALRDQNGIITRSSGDGFLKRVNILPSRRDGGSGRGSRRPGGAGHRRRRP